VVGDTKNDCASFENNTKLFNLFIYSTIHQICLVLHLLVLPQADKYVHRFGPGLILYWFGHAPLSILREVNDVVIAAWDLPRYFMLPTGDFIGRGTVQLSSYLMYPPTEEDIDKMQVMNT